MRSSAVPSRPEARPCESRDKARRITSRSAPHCTAIENTIAESRALVSAALLVLWLLRNSSAIEPIRKPADGARIAEASNRELKGLGVSAIGERSAGHRLPPKGAAAAR